MNAPFHLAASKFRALTSVPEGMMSDARVNRYYYIFDGREQRVLVRDRATGTSPTDAADTRTPLIKHVRARRSAAHLRRFARWCARVVEADTSPAHTAAGRLWAAVQREAPSTWQRVRRETADAAMLAVTLDLPRGRPEAARLLTLQACTHPDAEQAALDAAHMSERWAEFCAESNPDAAARAMRSRHVDWLLDSLSSP